MGIRAYINGTVRAWLSSIVNVSMRLENISFPLKSWISLGTNNSVNYWKYPLTTDGGLYQGNVNVWEGIWKLKRICLNVDWNRLRDGLGWKCEVVLWLCFWRNCLIRMIKKYYFSCKFVCYWLIKNNRVHIFYSFSN